MGPTRSRTDAAVEVAAKVGNSEELQLMQLAVHQMQVSSTPLAGRTYAIFSPPDGEQAIELANAFIDTRSLNQAIG